MLYPIARPPRVAGIYALVNKVSGHVYIGQSINLRTRYTEWVTLFGIEAGRSGRLSHVMRDTSIEDWNFRVVETLLGANRDTINAHEQQAIFAARRAFGLKVLNTTVKAAPRLAGTHQPALSIVKGGNGEALTHREVGFLLGYSKDAVKRKLRHLRATGIFEPTLAQVKGRP